jgi:hypothetical protein
MTLEKDNYSKREGASSSSKIHFHLRTTGWGITTLHTTSVTLVYSCFRTSLSLQKEAWQSCSRIEIFSLTSWCIITKSFACMTNEGRKKKATSSCQKDCMSTTLYLSTSWKHKYQTS